MTNSNKALRGMWGANRGPKLSSKQRKARKTQTVKMEAENTDRIKGWKAHR